MGKVPNWMDNMNREEIIKKLNAIFQDVFDNESIEITEDMKPGDIEEWDSIGHVYLTVEIEDEFHILLDERIKKIDNVSDIVDLIEEII